MTDSADLKTATSPSAAPLTPSAVWDLLRAGNERFVADTSNHPNQDAARRASLTHEQHPVAVIFGCSDSRLAAEIIFDVGLGDVFVVRTAGQVIDDAVLGSLEYSVDILDIPLIVVLGHDSCGAVTAAVDSYVSGEMPPGFIRSLVERIIPSVISARRAGVKDVNGTVAENVRQISSRLMESSMSVSKAVNEGRTAIIGVTYSLDNGTANPVKIIGDLDPDEVG